MQRRCRGTRNHRSSHGDRAAAGHTFYQRPLLFGEHATQQNELVDAVAERIQLLGGVSLPMAPDVAETR